MSKKWGGSCPPPPPAPPLSYTTAQVQRVNETESEALYSSINTSPTSQQNRNRPEAVHLPAAGDQSDAANGSHTIYDTIGSSMTQEGDVTEPTYNTLNFKTKPIIIRATESGSHLPLISPERINSHKKQGTIRTVS